MPETSAAARWLVRSRESIELIATGAVGKTGSPSVGLAATHAAPEPRPSACAEVAAQPRAHTHARTILYVEDNPANVKLVERILSLRPEITLVVTMQGEPAVDLAREHDPCLILLDLNLPDLSGEEVLRRLQLNPRTENMPVVVMSADTSPGQRQRLQTQGAADYLSKPFDVMQLLAIVDAREDSKL